MQGGKHYKQQTWVLHGNTFPPNPPPAPVLLHNNVEECVPFVWYNPTHTHLFLFLSRGQARARCAMSLPGRCRKFNVQSPLTTVKARRRRCGMLSSKPVSRLMEHLTESMQSGDYRLRRLQTPATTYRHRVSSAWRCGEACAAYTQQVLDDSGTC